MLVARRRKELEVAASAAVAAGAAQAEVFVADMGNSTDCKNLIRETVAKFGGIDTIILNHVSAHPFVTIHSLSFDT